MVSVTGMVKGKTAALLIGCNEIGLAINTEKTNCMVMSRGHHAGKNHNIKMGNTFCETVS
jgi:hypothetical protein